jgi:hypothetical protein
LTTKTGVVFSKVAVLAVGLASLSVLGYATPLCPTSAPGSLASIGVGTAGSGVSGACLFGATLFSNISIAGSSFFGTAQPGSIDPNDVNAQVTQVGNIISLTMTDTTAGDWSISGTQQFTIILNYTLSGGPWFVSFADSLSSSGSAGGAVSFAKSAENGSSPVQALPTLSAAGLSSNPQTTFTGSPAPPLSTVNITDNIQVQATNGAATLTSATNSFVVPEPMTSTLLGSGLLAFGLMLRRKRR